MYMKSNFQGIQISVLIWTIAGSPWYTALDIQIITLQGIRMFPATIKEEKL